MSARRLLARLHRWVGLASGLVVFIVGLTGAIYVWEAELFALSHRALVVVSRGGPRVPADDLLAAARAAVPLQKTPGAVLHDCASLCIALGSDGLRGELTLLRAARAQAAYERATVVTRAHLKTVAASALSHRLRRDPLDEAGSGSRVARILAETLP